MVRWVYKTLGGSKAPDLEDLKKWKEEGISTIINLLDGYYGDLLAQEQKRQGFEVIRMPSSMYTQYDKEEIIPVYEYIDELLNAGKKVVVHCKYGQARSGTFLAGYLIYKGFPYEKALEEVMKKGFLPQTQPQIDFLRGLSSR
ncbi:MAG: dual specificity protein phosphatase family protein [Aquificae bacterium]|nr:dual specificity protein phosphatase family protein [Aquificota bacterium]